MWLGAQYAVVLVHMHIMILLNVLCIASGMLIPNSFFMKSILALVRENVVDYFCSQEIILPMVVALCFDFCSAFFMPISFHMTHEHKY